MLRVPYTHRNQGHGVSGLLKTLSNVIRPIFSSAKTVIKPLASKVGDSLKKEGAQVLSDTAKSLLSNQPVISSVKKSLKKSKKRIKRKVKRTLKGKGKKKKKKKTGAGSRKKTKAKVKKRKKTTGGRKKQRKRKKKSSIFDAYTL